MADTDWTWSSCQCCCCCAAVVVVVVAVVLYGQSRGISGTLWAMMIKLHNAGPTSYRGRSDVDTTLARCNSAINFNVCYQVIWIYIHTYTRIYIYTIIYIYVIFVTSRMYSDCQPFSGYFCYQNNRNVKVIVPLSVWDVGLALARPSERCTGVSPWMGQYFYSRIYVWLCEGHWVSCWLWAANSRR